MLPYALLNPLLLFVFVKQSLLMFLFDRRKHAVTSEMSAVKDNSFNRRLYDGCKTTDDLRLTTGPGRYQLDVPTGYCDAAYVAEPTTRQQKWGASLNSQYTKTDVESDLFNINRPTTRTGCSQYDPQKNKVNNTSVVPPKETSFPQVFSRLIDPPCTGRASGWNRWEWLCDNPQETVMVPFDNLVTTRLQQKDQFRPCIPKPVDPNSLLPAPLSYEQGSLYDNASEGNMNRIVSGLQEAFQQLPQGMDSIPAAPSALSGVEANPVNPPSIAYAPYRQY
jgi:hypothetical protein